MDRTQASRRRLLDAAAAEFAEHGIAGSRVDRISTTARVSKAQLYSYYQSKEQLFDAVLDEQVQDILNVAPLTAEDLPGYAVRLYDAYLANPRLVRLATWARLERTPAGPLFAASDEKAKVGAIESAQTNGDVVTDIAAQDVHSMVIAMAMTWSPNSLTYSATDTDPDAEHQRRRSSLAAAVRRAFAP